MRHQVLIVEDEKEIAQLLALHLDEVGYRTTLAHSGDEGLKQVLKNSFDLVILDLTLPDVDGIDICRRLRAEPDYTPILMLTARTSELDRVLGLEVGADDYVSKPFSMREVAARVKAILRRTELMQQVDAEDAEPQPLEIGDLAIDPARRQVRRGEAEVSLTAREFDLLYFFARHPGRVFTRSQLLDQVWGYGHDGYEHTVNSHINRLRAKLEPDPSEPHYLLTVWGVGYRFFEP